MDMQSYISTKLRSIENLSDREYMRSVMEQVFCPLYDHMMEQYQCLEKRIYDEMPFVSRNFSIYTTLLIPKDAKESTWLSPIDELDLERKLETWGALQEKSKVGKEIILTTLFLKEDYLVCARLEANNRSYPIRIMVEDHEVLVRAKIKPSIRYQEKIVTLYHHFQSNGIPWMTPYLPYCRKMFDVIIDSSSIEGGYISDAPLKVYYDFGAEIPSYQLDLIPVWNVQAVEVERSLFPMPTPERINYEYRFALSDCAKNGYLVNLNNPHLISIRREADAIIAVSPKKGNLAWSVLKIGQYIFSPTEQFAYPLISNAQEDSFIGRLVLHHAVAVNTIAEIKRQIESFQSAKELLFDSLSIVQNLVKSETYDVNEFIADEIRDRNNQKTMIIKFRAAGNKSYLTRDCMSFLVSQIQLICPEFICVGVLV